MSIKRLPNGEIVISHQDFYWFINGVCLLFILIGVWLAVSPMFEIPPELLEAANNEGMSNLVGDIGSKVELARWIMPIAFILVPFIGLIANRHLTIRIDPATSTVYLDTSGLFRKESASHPFSQVSSVSIVREEIKGQKGEGQGWSYPIYLNLKEGNRIDLDAGIRSGSVFNLKPSHARIKLAQDIANLIGVAVELPDDGKS